MHLLFMYWVIPKQLTAIIWEDRLRYAIIWEHRLRCAIIREHRLRYAIWSVGDFYERLFQFSIFRYYIADLFPPLFLLLIELCFFFFDSFSNFIVDPLLNPLLLMMIHLCHKVLPKKFLFCYFFHFLIC